MTANELKKEAWDYMVDHAILNETNKDVEQAYFDAAEPREEKIADLKKENEELQEQNIKDCENFNKTMSETKERWNKEHYQLAKAKSIIQSFVWWHTSEDRGSINSNDLVERAKQFLSEVKK